MATGQEDVNLTTTNFAVTWHLTLSIGERGKGGVQTAQEGTVSSTGDVSRGNSQRGTLGKLSGDVQGWEALESGGRAVGASGEERAGQSDDGSGVDWSVERGGEGGFSVGESDVGVVTGLNSQDGGRSGKVSWVLDGTSGTEVGRDTNTLKDLGDSHEGLGVSVGEGVVASLDRGGTSGSKSRGQKVDVGSLIIGDDLDLSADFVTETSVAERLLVVLGKTLGVERGLEVLKGQREVEDIGIGDVTGGAGGLQARSGHHNGANNGGGSHSDRVGLGRVSKCVFVEVVKKG